MSKNKSKIGKPDTKTVTVHSFAEIGEAITQLKLSVPKLKSLKGLDGLSGSVKEKMEAAKKIRGDVADALKFLLGSSKQLTACADHDERRFVMEELKEPEAEARAYLTQVLELKGALKTVAAAAYLKTVFTLDYTSHEQVQAMLNDMVSRGLLTSAGTGSPIMVGYLHYRLGDFGFDEADVAGISAVVEQFSRTAKTMENQRRQALTVELEKMAEVSLPEVLAGKNGRCLVDVPSEGHTDKQGKSHWYGGGRILFDFQKEFVVPVRASGSCERLIADIEKRGGKITRHSLTWDTPPGWNSLVNWGVRNLDLNRPSAEAYAKDFSTLWHMAQRGIRHHKEKLAQAEIKADMEKRAQITPLQFFGLNGLKGKPVEKKAALLQFDGAFKARGSQRLFNPFFLAVRTTENGTGFFEVAEIPPHLQGILGNYVGKKFPIDDYRGCPDLGDLMESIKGQCQMAATTAAK